MTVAPLKPDELGIQCTYKSSQPLHHFVKLLRVELILIRPTTVTDVVPGSCSWIRICINLQQGKISPYLPCIFFSTDLWPVQDLQYNPTLASASNAVKKIICLNICNHHFLFTPLAEVPAVHAVEDHELESLYECCSRILVSVYLHGWYKGVDKCRNQEGSKFRPNIRTFYVFLCIYWYTQTDIREII